MNKKYPKDRLGFIALLLILPLSIVFMLVVGQIAIWIFPDWSVNASMDSKLSIEDANNTNGQARPIQPISQDIIDLPDWWFTFLESGVDVEIVIVPLWEISPTPPTAPSAVPPPSASPPAVTPSQTPPPSATPPSNPTKPAQSNICTDPAASNNGGPLPCTYPPTTCTDPAASNNGGPLPCTYPPTTCTDPAASNNGGSLPCLYPVVSTPVGTNTTVDPNINVGAPTGNPVGSISDGFYIVLQLSAFGSPSLQVVGPSDTNYDLAYFELYRSGTNDIAMDSVIVSISSNGTDYYEVFNWGDGIPDTNSNVGIVASTTGTENDNQSISSTVLYGTNPTQTGILINVDNAPSHPPPGSYDWISIQAPLSPPGDGNDGADVDSIQIVDVVP